MSDAFGRLFEMVAQKLFVVLMLALLLAPEIVFAEQLLFLYNEDLGQLNRLSQRQEFIRKSAQRSTSLGLNKNGDMEIRHGDVSLVMAYNAPNEIVEPQERVRIAQRQEIPNINGVSLRVNFQF
jgi:hypothetical protein